jgi:putative transferase (TIGR04331 family)
METSIKEKVPWCIDIKLRHEAVKDCIDYCDQMLPIIANQLNEIHNIKYPIRFWHILLGPWLTQFIGLMIDRIHLVKGASENNIKISKKKTKRIIPKDSYDSLKLAEIHNYNNQILSDIIYAIDGKVVSEKFDNFDYVREIDQFLTDVSFSQEVNIRKSILNYLSSIFSGSKTIFVSTSSIPVKMHLQLALRVKGFRTISPLREDSSKYTSNINLQLRQSMSLADVNSLHKFKNKVKSEIYQILTKLTHLYIPVCYLEGFKKLQTSIVNYPNQPGVILMGTELWGRYESFVHWAALCAINGTVINTMQHGGTNANEKSSEFVFPEINPYNGYYTWGWKWYKYGVDVNKLIPMPSSFLMNKKPHWITENKGSYLFVVTCIQPQVRRLSGSEGDPYINKNYMRDQLIFVNALSRSLQDQLKVRLYKDDLGQKYDLHWKKNFPHVRFDDISVNFNTALKGTDVYISDHLSTTWLEALNLNIPTVLFIDRSIYNFSPDAWKYFNLLEESGILHFSPLNAAKHLENVADKLEIWWNTEKTQKNLQTFLDVFGNNPTNGMQLWATELCRLRNSSQLNFIGQKDKYGFRK